MVSLDVFFYPELNMIVVANAGTSQSEFMSSFLNVEFGAVSSVGEGQPNELSRYVMYNHFTRQADKIPKTYDRMEVMSVPSTSLEKFD